MPFKSKAQRRWMYANHPQMAKEWSAHTPKNAKLPEKVKKAYQEPEDEESKKNSFLEDYLRATVGHRLADAGLSHLIRKNNLFSNYYANLAREGINSALTGVDLAPTTRQGFGLISPTITGLGSYETAKALARQIKDSIEKETGQKITSIDQLVNHPLAKKYLPKADVGQLSPISRDIVNALNPNLASSKIVDTIKRYAGVGQDNQANAAAIGGILSAGIGGLTGGSAGALGSLTSTLPEITGAHMLNTGNADTIIGLKKRVLARGAAHGVTGPGTAQSLTSLGLGAASPLAHEVYQLGQDVGKPLGQNVDRYQNIYQKFTKPFNFIPGKGKLDEFVAGRANRVKQNIANKLENALLSPNLGGKIKKFFR